MIDIYLIIAATLLLAGVVSGGYRAFRNVLGYSNPSLFGDVDTSAKLGIAPIVIVQIGGFVSLSRLFDLTKVSLFRQEHFVMGLWSLIGLGALLSVELTVLRNVPLNRRSLLLIGLSDAMIGVVAGGIFPNGTDMLVGGLVGALIGLCEVLLRVAKILPGSSDHDRSDLLPFWSVAWIGGAHGFDEVLAVGLLGLFLIVIGNALLPRVLRFVGEFAAALMTPELIVLRFKRILCNHCLSYTIPLRSRYEAGRRYCEHCHEQVEDTRESGKVAITFGKLQPQLAGRVFVLSDPDFETYDRAIEISEVHIDPATCDERLIEKFITYSLEHPPTQGRQSVQVFYARVCEQLGANLRNALQNNFTCMPAVPSDMQSDGSNSYRTVSVTQVAPPALPLTWRCVLEKIGGAFVGGILGIVGGSLLLIVFADVEFFSVFASPDATFTFSIGWIGLATLLGIRQGVQKSQKLAKSALSPMIILLFFLLLTAIVIPNLMSATCRSRRNRSAADMRAIGTALGAYLVDFNQYPSTHGLDTPITDEQTEIGQILRDENYYDGVLWDGWKSPFICVSDGASYTLTSYGKDRKPGEGKLEMDSDILFVNGQFKAPSALVDR